MRECGTFDHVIFHSQLREYYAVIVAPWEGQLAYDTLVFVLTAIKTYSSWRAQRHGGNRLFIAMIFRDGASGHREVLTLAYSGALGSMYFA